MCGRFTHPSDLDELTELIPGLKIDEPLDGPRYNVAPSQQVPTVLNDGERRLRMTQWGLIPSWAKDPAIGNKMINARGETVHEKPSFRTSFRRRRCLIVANGFYEWGKPKGAERKLPFYFRLKTGKPFGFAGLWDTWRDPESEDEEGAMLVTCTIITTSANEIVSRVHHRMPVILGREGVEPWLDPGEAEAGDLRRLIAPYPAEEMEVYAVSREVNNPRNEGERLVEPEQGELF